MGKFEAKLMILFCKTGWTIKMRAVGMSPIAFR